MTSRNRKFRMEQLEARQMMAGDIHARVTNGDLIIEESSPSQSEANTVQVTQLANGNIRVAGGNNFDGGVSKVNGAAYQDFTVAGSLYVNLGSGSDLLVMGGTGPAPTFDQVIIDTSETGAVASSDKDHVIVWDVSTINLYIETGAGNDRVFVSNPTAGPWGGEIFDILTGAGSDVVTVSNSPETSIIHVWTGLSTENDIDKVTISNVVADRLTVALGGGNDELSVTNAVVNGGFSIYADAGDDKVELKSVAVADALMARMGEGSDTLLLDYVDAETMTLLGEGGIDCLKKTNTSHSQLSQSGWEWINGVRQWFPPMYSYPLASAMK